MREDAKESSSLFSCNMCRESEVTDLRGGVKVAVAGGRSGIVLSRESGLRGKTGCHAGLRSEERKRQHALFPMVAISGLATALRAATTIIKIVFVFVLEFILAKGRCCGEPVRSVKISQRLHAHRPK
jgi:hypothetical protein